ncbi:MAG: insulinase family protein [Betaproteobacteria bacterium]|nr:insulinase family protein [Betaproteobacteria bacterium]
MFSQDIGMRFTKSFFAMVVALIASFMTVAEAQLKLPAGMSAGPAVEGISEYRLANGLTVLLITDASQDTITTNIVYLVGSRHEGYGEAGMAHLLEHMLFKGTPSHPNIKSEFLTRGARYNGTTSFDRTNYFQTFPAQGDNLAWSLELEADRMLNAYVSKKDLDSEMTVVRNEFEAGENSPFSVLRERMSAASYQWHNYGRSVIGSRSDIENVPIERLQAFYRHYYQPDNAVLVIAGRIDAAATLQLVAKHFGPIPRPARKLQTTYTAEPTQDGERQVMLRRAGNVQIVSTMYHVPPGTHADYPALDILTLIVSNVPAGRLHKAMIESGKAASIFGYERQQREAGAAFFGASVRQDASIDAAREALLATVEGFAAQPVTDAEVERARTALLGEIEKAAHNSRSLAITLSEFVALGDWRFLFWFRDQVVKLKREDVQRIALTYFKRDNRTLGLFVPTDKPDRAEIPAAPDLAALLKDYAGQSAIAQGEVFDATPEHIERRLLRRQLASGIRLALLPKKTRGETVVASLALRWGDEASKTDRGMACSLAGAMLPRGTRNHSRTELRDQLTKLRANVNVSLEGGTIDTTRANLPAAFNLMVEMLRYPTFPSNELDQLREASRTNLDVQRADPSSLASLQISRHLHPYPPTHWHYTPSLDERATRLSSVSIDELKRCHGELVGASNAELTIVGDFDPDEMARLAEQLLGDWKSPRPYARVPSRFFDVRALSNSIQTPDKANAVYRAGMSLQLQDDNPDFPALVLANYMLGGSSDARLTRRIREKEGLSYSVGSWLTAGAEDAVGEFGVSAIYAPQNRERLETAVREEIDDVLKKGFAKEEIELAKKGLLQARRVARNQDSTLAARINGYQSIGRTFAWDIALEKAIAALTAEKIHAAFRRHINMGRLSVVRAGDFARVTAGSNPSSAN